jgi:hypothetical protein
VKDAGKELDPQSLAQNYKKSLKSYRSSKALRDRVLRSQALKQVAIQSHVDIRKLVEDTMPHSAKNADADDLERADDQEPIDLAHVDPTQSSKLVRPSKPTEGPEEAAGSTGGAKGPDEGMQEEWREEFAVYNLNYDFETDGFVALETINPVFLTVPAERDVYKFCKKIMICSKMEKEIPVIALLYIEKLMLKTGLLMNALNWRRFTFIALVIGSKIWDDESFENIHFTKVFPDISLKEINELERVYLELLDYKLHISGSEYAKYYFILRTFAERVQHKFPLRPMPLAKILALQKNAKKVEGNLQATRQHDLLEKTF